MHMHVHTTTLKMMWFFPFPKLAQCFRHSFTDTTPHMRRRLRSRSLGATKADKPSESELKGFKAVVDAVPQRYKVRTQASTVTTMVPMTTAQITHLRIGAARCSIMDNNL